MHFEVRILAQLLEWDEDAAIALRQTQFGASIGARAPDFRDLRGEFRGRCAAA
jgi:hypothetical protein